MKIFITGATGYIGHKLALAAVARGYQVHALVRDPGSKWVPRHPSITIFKGDITDRDSLRTAMQGCEKVLHAAGVTKFRSLNQSVFYEINVEGTRNVLDTALVLGVRKLVYTSTGAVLGPSGKLPVCENDPRIVAFENDYEISKHWAEELVKEYSHKGLFTVIVSAPRVYGPGPMTGGNPFGTLLRTILRSGIGLIPAKGDVIANYAFVDDVVAGHFLALDNGLGGEKYILGGENLSYNEFFRGVCRQAGRRICLIHIPRLPLLIWSFLHVNICNLLKKDTNVSPRTINRMLQNRLLSSDKAVRQLHYSITPFEDAIAQTILSIKKRNV